MKISTNLTEIKELFANHLGIKVSELELTIESEVEIANTDANHDGWIINTKMSDGHPDTLKGSDFIQVEYSDGEIVYGHAADWSMRWNITGAINYIDKYRKTVNK